MNFSYETQSNTLVIRNTIKSLYETLPRPALLKLVFNSVKFWPIYFFYDPQPGRICLWPRTVSPCTCSRKRTMCLTRITLTCIKTWADRWRTTTSLPLITRTSPKTRWPAPAAQSLISGTKPTPPYNLPPAPQRNSIALGDIIIPKVTVKGNTFN